MPLVLCLALMSGALPSRSWAQNGDGSERKFIRSLADGATGLRVGFAGLRLDRAFRPRATVAAGPAELATGGSSSDLAACIRDRGCVRLFLVVHRAKGLGAPDNSRAAFSAAVTAGIPLIETDVVLSKDGEMFILHGDDLDGPTRGGGRLRGKVSDYTAAQLDAVLLDNGETLPRFLDLYAISRGRAVLDLDFKHNAVERVAEFLQREGSFDDVLFFVNNEQEMEAAARMKKKYPAMMVMPRIRGWLKLRAIRRIFGGLPEVIHADVSIWTPVEDLHAEGVKVFVKSLDEEKEPDPGALDRKLDSGADFILTNDALRLRKRLRERRTSPSSH